MIELYRDGFVKAFQSLASGLWSDGRVVSYRSVGWADKHLPALMQAIAFVKAELKGKLQIDLRDNAFSEQGYADLKRMGDDRLEMITTSPSEQMD